MAELPVKRLADWVIRLVLPLGVLATVLAVFFGELMSVDHELQLLVPGEVRPGDPIPMQALLFSGLDRDEPPELVSSPVRIRVTDAAGEPLGSTVLAPSVAGGAAGGLAGIDAEGTARLSAVALLDGAPVASLSTTLRVRRDAERAPLVGRSARAVQHFAPGPVVAAEGRAPPAPFDVRVRGGACVPETPCALLVHVGDPGAAVRLVANAALTPSAASARETSGLVELPFVVHGPEASVIVEATRGDELVAHRGVRVPVALATPGLELDSPIVRDGAPELTVHVLGDRPGVVVDAFRDGRWVATGAVRPSAEPFRAPLSLPQGLVRLQVRTDPFAAHHASARHVVVGGALEETLAAAEREGGSAPVGTPPELRIAWALAPLEESLRQVPAAVSGREVDRGRLAARQRTLRLVALVAIVLGLAVFALVFVRRGLDAAHEAQRVMAETGDPELGSARHQRRTLLSALAIVATLLLAFLGAAALVIARARLLE